MNHQFKPEIQEHTLLEMKEKILKMEHLHKIS